MSKGINLLNHFNAPKTDGHKVISYNKFGAVVYCPKTKDNYNSTHTSNGIICGQCNKMI